MVFVGLGNPGAKYQRTRHNAGRDWVDFWCHHYRCQGRENKKLLTVIFQHQNFLFACPLVFMNESGRAVEKLLSYYKIPPAKLCLVHDELDLPLGQWKLSFGRSSPLHKGVLSVEAALGSRDFWRLRLGIDNRTPYQRLPGEEYVLQKFTPAEWRIFHQLLQQLEPAEVVRAMN